MWRIRTLTFSVLASILAGMPTRLDLRQHRSRTAPAIGSRRLSMALRVLPRLGLAARLLRLTLLRLARPHLTTLTFSVLASILGL